MSETILRSRFLLSTIFLRNGLIDEQVLRDLLSPRTIRGTKPTADSTEAVPLKRSEITTMLLQAIPPFTEEMPLDELLQMSIGLAALLSIVGIGRKEAFILRELLQRLTPGLIQARKVGAAEMGIHPDAGPWSLGNASHASFSRIEKRTKSLLRLVGAMYATLDATDRIIVSNPSSTAGMSLTVSSLARLHPNGNFYLKLDILKSCIAICEVLPDFDGVLKYSLHLLHLSRRVILMPSSQPPGTPAIPQEEQAGLLDGIKRTTGAAARFGMGSIMAEYWDDFLVRKVELTEPPAALTLATHTKGSLQSRQESEEKAKKDPFIYKPSSESTSTATDQSLVANEVACFNVYLQNPFEIEIEIDEISLMAEGCEFLPSRHNIVLGHFCCKKFTLTGTPRSSGTLKITGCRAKIRCCKERDFHIYSQNASSTVNFGAKKIEYAAQNDLLGRQTATAVEITQSAANALAAGPLSDIMVFTVLEPQPVISFQSTSLSQPCLMLLEGERRRFEVVLRNESSAVPADFINFNFEDSATSQLRTALKNQDLSPSELYELQLQLAEKTPFKHVVDNEEEKLKISAGGTATFTIEVLGIPGLLNGIIKVEYAYLGTNLQDVKETYYTREISLVVAVTVNAGIEAPRCNLQSFSKDYAWWHKQRTFTSSTQVLDSPSTKGSHVESLSALNSTGGADSGPFLSQLARLGAESSTDGDCLLVLDLRNAWPFPLSVSVQVRDIAVAEMSSDGASHRAYDTHEVLQPGHMTRVVLSIPRLEVPEPHAPIPLIGTQRQFVVSSTKSSAQIEQANREAFWFREELLKRLVGSWREESTGREGSIDLRRGIRLNSRMIDALKLEEVEISISVQPTIQSDCQPLPLRQKGQSRFVIPTNYFATLAINVHNRSSTAIHALLRVQPLVRDQPQNIALDLSKRLAWTGMLQRALHPALRAGEVRETRLGIMALSTGEYGIGASIEELKATTQRAKGPDLTMPKVPNERRVWHARELCSLDAVGSMQSR